jgi:hypothetical protein
MLSHSRQGRLAEVADKQKHSELGHGQARNPAAPYLGANEPHDQRNRVEEFPGAYVTGSMHLIVNNNY